MHLSNLLINRGCLAAYCWFSYATYLVLLQFLYGGEIPEIEPLIALFAAPLLFLIWPSIGTPTFAITHSLWTFLLALSVLQWFLLEPDFRIGELGNGRLLINGFFSVLNFGGLVWLTMYSQKRTNAAPNKSAASEAN